MTQLYNKLIFVAIKYSALFCKILTHLAEIRTLSRSEQQLNQNTSIHNNSIQNNSIQNSSFRIRSSISLITIT